MPGAHDHGAPDGRDGVVVGTAVPLQLLAGAVPIESLGLLANAYELIMAARGGLAGSFSEAGAIPGAKNDAASLAYFPRGKIENLSPSTGAPALTKAAEHSMRPAGSSVPTPHPRGLSSARRAVLLLGLAGFCAPLASCPPAL
jgi:hypothetical protein